MSLELLELLKAKRTGENNVKRGSFREMIHKNCKFGDEKCTKRNRKHKGKPKVSHSANGTKTAETNNKKSPAKKKNVSKHRKQMGNIIYRPTEGRLIEQKGKLSNSNSTVTTKEEKQLNPRENNSVGKMKKDTKRQREILNDDYIEDMEQRGKMSHSKNQGNAFK